MYESPQLHANKNVQKLILKKKKCTEINKKVQQRWIYIGNIGWHCEPNNGLYHWLFVKKQPSLESIGRCAI